MRLGWKVGKRLRLLFIWYVGLESITHLEEDEMRHLVWLPNLAKLEIGREELCIAPWCWEAKNFLKPVTSGQLINTTRESIYRPCTPFTHYHNFTTSLNFQFWIFKISSWNTYCFFVSKLSRQHIKNAAFQAFFLFLSLTLSLHEYKAFFTEPSKVWLLIPCNSAHAFIDYRNMYIYMNIRTL